MIRRWARGCHTDKEGSVGLHRCVLLSNLGLSGLLWQLLYLVPSCELIELLQLFPLPAPIVPKRRGGD